MRRPFAGAWIETLGQSIVEMRDAVAPLQGRGLKPVISAQTVMPSLHVAPLQGRGLKPEQDVIVVVSQSVAPLQGRGLKRSLLTHSLILIMSPLCRGVD